MRQLLVVWQLAIESRDGDADDNATGDRKEDRAAEEKPAEGHYYRTMRGRRRSGDYSFPID
jgi:hypothetical protein